MTKARALGRFQCTDAPARRRTRDEKQRKVVHVLPPGEYEMETDPTTGTVRVFQFVQNDFDPGKVSDGARIARHTAETIARINQRNADFWSKDAGPTRHLSGGGR